MRACRKGKKRKKKGKRKGEKRKEKRKEDEEKEKEIEEMEEKRGRAHYFSGLCTEDSTLQHDRELPDGPNVNTGHIPQTVT